MSEKTNNYNLYTGLGVHDPSYEGSVCNVTEDEAYEALWDLKEDKFSSYQGIHGVPTFAEICDSVELDPFGEWSENEEMAYQDAYSAAVEDHINGYVRITEEDLVNEDELFYLD